MTDILRTLSIFNCLRPKNKYTLFRSIGLSSSSVIMGTRVHQKGKVGGLSNCEQEEIHSPKIS